MNVDVNKIKADIVDLEDKKKTLLLSLQSDIESIEAEMKREFCEIGQRAYTLAFEGEGTLSAMAGDFAKIDEYKAAQELKEKKKCEIAERYNEEIQILEKLVPKEPEVAPAAEINPGKGFCTNCGKPYTYGEDMFCLKCGTKLAS
jgi:hypothetical protein